ncbi:ANTAR domain-containing protein [Arthrobacter sp. Soc17.1.1.1]|uniref:ANTAR domain-containing protein n=1 Tax=Arthrobacter sp. Soc17.1.1.1 TaxID=3121277 RepID=UPI002FE4CA53
MNNTDAVTYPGADLLRSPSFRRTATDDEFEAALEGRRLVDTAVGIVMGKHDCDRVTALSNLQQTARTFDVTVAELARGLVSSAGRT